MTMQWKLSCTNLLGHHWWELYWGLRAWVAGASFLRAGSHSWLSTNRISLIHAYLCTLPLPQCQWYKGLGQEVKSGLVIKHWPKEELTLGGNASTDDRHYDWAYLRYNIYEYICIHIHVYVYMYIHVCVCVYICI